MKCWTCGKEVKGTYIYHRCYCDECKKKKAEEAKTDFAEYWRLKNKMMIERAVKKIEETTSHVEPIEFYKKAIEVVSDYTLKNPTKLASTEEAIVAIVLTANRIHTKCQHHILNFRVDFLLPDIQTVLEIDGNNHNTFKDTKRDLQILRELGKGWEIVRIPTWVVNMDPQLLPNTIMEERIKKEEYRQKNGKTLAIEIAAVMEEKELEKEAKRKAKEAEDRYKYGADYVKITQALKARKNAKKSKMK